MYLFTGVTADWGFSAADIFTNGMFLVGAVAAFVLLGIAIKYVPVIIAMIKGASAYRGAYGKGYGVRGFAKEFSLQAREQKEIRGDKRRRG